MLLFNFIQYRLISFDCKGNNWHVFYSDKNL